MNRREFVQQGTLTTLGFGAGLTVVGNAASVRGSSANDKINLGFIGCGGRGQQLLREFVQRNDVNVLHCCDPYRQKAETAVKIVEKSELKSTPTLSSDLRTVLDDPKVDAVVCATPDHWHALGTVWACQAGKDVYTEKPASHSAWEGRQMVKAARKYKRIVQHGTQCRSASYCMAARKYIEDGKLGRIHFVRVYNMKEWKNFTLAPPTPVPAEIDWERWIGPAPMRPFSVSYSSAWHHLWDFSSGDMINDGIHQLDLARWLIGKEVPKSAYCVGGRFDSHGDAESPDTQITTWEFDDLTMTFELTLYTPYMLKIDPEVRNSDMFPYWMQCATRIEIYGSDGLMMVGRHGGGWEVYVRPKDRKPVVKDSMYGRFPDPEHKENFLNCVRSRELPNADIEIGHRSTMLAHYATISYRLGGQKLNIDTKTEAVLDNPAASKLFKRDYRAPFVVPDEV